MGACRGCGVCACLLEGRRLSALNIITDLVHGSFTFVFLFFFPSSVLLTANVSHDLFFLFHFLCFKPSISFFACPSFAHSSGVGREAYSSAEGTRVEGRRG